MSSLESDIKYCVSKYGARLDDYIVDTVFFGGGTPSYVSPQLIAGILKTLKSEFAFDENPEISIECNPGTIDNEKMRVYAESGFNRCSIGLQSVQDDLLKQIGRIHTFKEFEEGFSAARNAGFKNINIDVMSALPGQSVTDYVNGLNKIIEYKPEHISAYSLIVEEGTPVYEHPESFLRFRLRTMNGKCTMKLTESLKKLDLKDMRYRIIQKKDLNADTMLDTGKEKIILDSGLVHHRFLKMSA